MHGIYPAYGIAMVHVPYCYSAPIIPKLQGKIARWWIPEDVVFVKEIPHTATGKIYKLQLRKDFKDYKFPSSKL